MLTAFGLVILGIVLLAVGGEALVRGAVALAGSFKLSPAVIGLTVVAIGTSVPELAVSVAASLDGSNDLAVANVVGSNILNVAVILGLCALIKPIAIGGSIFKLEYPVLLVVTLMAVVLASDGNISRLEAGLLLVSYVAFTTYAVVIVRRQVTTSEVKELTAEVDEIEARKPNRGPLVDILLLGVGIALLGAGAEVTVKGAVEIARSLGMTERVIGLTIVAAGTSLPEVMASVVSSLRGRNDIAIGNVIGSNLFNLMGVLGIAGLIKPLQVNASIISSDNWWMLGTTIIILPLMLTGRRLARWEGGLLIAVYGSYLAILLGAF